MAIDKNSKAYQSLLNKWYTDEQITQMSWAAASWQDRNQIVASTKPINAPTTEKVEYNGRVEMDKPTPTQTTTNQSMGTPIKQQEKVGSTVWEIKQTGALKPKSDEYYQQTSDEALTKIKDNLNNYRQTNPEYFKDYESYKKNFSYDSRNEQQKQVLDTFYNWYQQGLQLSATPVNDLYTQYKNGQISVNDLENLRVANPTKYAELQNQINKWNIIAAYDDTNPTWNLSIQDMAYQLVAQSFNRMSSNDYWTSQYFDEFKANMNSPEMMELQDKTTELDEQYKNIEDKIASITKDVEKEYEGTWATKSKINAIVSDRTYDLQQQLRSIGNEYTKYATQYNNRATQYQNEFQLQLQEYQLNMQARNQQMNELWFALDLMNFETNEQKQQREWDYWVKQQEYTNWNIESKDYQTRYKAALKSVQNLLSQYEGIPMKRSAEQMAQDILTAIDNGSNLGAELTKLNTQIQNKPEYKQLYNNTFGTKGWVTDSFTVWDTQYVVYDGKMMTATDFNKQYWGKSSGKAYNVVSSDVFKTYSDGRSWTYGSFINNSKHDDGKYGWQCGKFVNDYLEEIWVGRYYDDNLDTKLNSVNSDSGKVWTIAVFDYGKKSSDGINHGHVAIVISWPDKNGNIWVKDSNFSGDEKITTRIVNMNDASLKWFFDPSLSPDGSKPTQQTTTTTWSKTTNTTGTTTTTTKTTLPWWLTKAWVEQLAKDMLNWEKTYSEIKAAYWDEGLNVIENKMLELQANWFERSTKITDPTKLSNVEKNWRDFYDKKASDAQETLDWVRKMEEAYNLVDTDKNAASQAITIAYNKILDPGSVVREWEYARSAEWQSYLSQIQAKLEKMKDGWAWLTKNELNSMIQVAKKFSENAEKTQLNAARQAKVAIDKYGLTPEAVLPMDVLNKLEWGDYTETTQTHGTATTENWTTGLNKSSNVFQSKVNVWWVQTSANFYQK